MRNKIIPLLCLLGMIFCVSFADAQPPDLLNYQGVLLDESGQRVNGDLSIIFTLYAAEEEGDPLWRETRQIHVDNGLYSVRLGEVTPFGDLTFDRPLYLGIKIDPFEEMTPRILLTGAPYVLCGAGGLSCWDLNANGQCDLPLEDVNNDGVCDALDCQGAPGDKSDKGDTGATGPQGLQSDKGDTGADGPENALNYDNEAFIIVQTTDGRLPMVLIC